MALEPLPLAPGPGPDLRGRNLTTNVLQCHIQSFTGRRDCLTQKGRSSRKLTMNARWWAQSFQATGDLSGAFANPTTRACVSLQTWAQVKRASPVTGYNFFPSQQHSVSFARLPVMSLHCHARPTPHTEDPDIVPTQEEGSDTGDWKGRCTHLPPAPQVQGYS